MRITQQIGSELRQQHERDAALHQRRELPATNEQPVGIACVQVDGGRIRTRAPDAGPGVHDHAWKESKVAALWRMEGPTFTEDPQPEPRVSHGEGACIKWLHAEMWPRIR